MDCCGMGCENCREIAVEVELANPLPCRACGRPAVLYRNKVTVGEDAFCSSRCADDYVVVSGVMDS